MRFELKKKAQSTKAAHKDCCDLGSACHCLHLHVLAILSDIHLLDSATGCEATSRNRSDNAADIYEQFALRCLSFVLSQQHAESDYFCNNQLYVSSAFDVEVVEADKQLFPLMSIIQ